MKLDNGDILGEDSFIYNRDSTYTAKIVSLEATLYQIDSRKFVNKFSSALNGIKKKFDLRNELADKLVFSQQ